MGFESQARNWFLLVLCYLHQRVLVFITDFVFGLAFSIYPKFTWVLSIVKEMEMYLK